MMNIRVSAKKKHLRGREKVHMHISCYLSSRLSICMPVCLSVDPASLSCIDLSICPSTYPSINLPISLSCRLAIYLYACLSAYPSIQVHASVDLSICPSTYPSIYLPISIYIYISISISLSHSLSPSLSVCLSLSLSFVLSLHYSQPRFRPAGFNS